MDINRAIELLNKNTGCTGGNDGVGKNIALGIILGAKIIADQRKENNEKILSSISPYLEASKKVIETAQEKIEEAGDL